MPLFKSPTSIGSHLADVSAEGGAGSPSHREGGAPRAAPSVSSAKLSVPSRVFDGRPRDNGPGVLSLPPRDGVDEWFRFRLSYDHDHDAGLDDGGPFAGTAVQVLATAARRRDARRSGASVLSHTGHFERADRSRRCGCGRGRGCGFGGGWYPIRTSPASPLGSSPAQAAESR